MSYNFKKIMDLELVNEVPEGANVLIEADGATKRLPSTAIKSEDGGALLFTMCSEDTAVKCNVDASKAVDLIANGVIPVGHFFTDTGIYAFALPNSAWTLTDDVYELYYSFGTTGYSSSITLNIADGTITGTWSKSGK